MNTQLAKKVGIVFMLGVLVVLFFAFGLQQYLTLEYMKASQARFGELYATHTFLVLAIYFVLYVLVTALNLPGAAIMTLVGGGLFGFWVGLLVVSFASTIGATCASFMARYLLRDFVQSKFEDRLVKVNKGIEREGAFYLFTMRLIPVVPFFAINLVMGLTKMPLLTYYWVSQIGMLPGTMVYVNAGKELGKIDSLAGILSPGLLVSFILLGLFPLIIKKIMAVYRAKSGRGNV